MSRKPKGRGLMNSLLRERNWFVSAGLVLVIYAAVWYYIRTYSSLGISSGDVSPLAHLLGAMIHVLPVLAIALAAYGWWERRRASEEDRERKRKRYEARMEISRLKRGADDQRPPSAP